MCSVVHQLPVVAFLAPHLTYGRDADTAASFVMSTAGAAAKGAAAAAAKVVVGKVANGFTA